MRGKNHNAGHSWGKNDQLRSRAEKIGMKSLSLILSTQTRTFYLCFMEENLALELEIQSKK